MCSNNKLARSQQQRIQKYTHSTHISSLCELLERPELMSTVTDSLPEHRERTYPPVQTLSMFMTQAMSADGSCQNAVNKVSVDRQLNNLPRISLSTGGYCQARKRLPVSILSELTRQTGELMDSQIPDGWRWRGRRVHLIDGTTAGMPDTEDNQKKYPQSGTQKPGVGFPICRVLGIICLSSGAVLNASIGPCKGKGSDEQTLLRKVMTTFQSEDLVLGDAFFGTFFLLASLISKGVDAVFEQMGVRRKGTDFRKGKILGTKDHVVALAKPKKKPDWVTQEAYDDAPDEVEIREVRVDGRTLITTLLTPKCASKNELKILYKKRWQIEVDFRDIKTTMDMEPLSCKSPDMIEKEIWVYFLAYNLVRLLMLKAALLTDILPRQVSFKHTLQLWLAWSQLHTSPPDDNQTDIQLFYMIGQKQVGNRPGRVEPRALKRRPKPYALLVRPREEMRAEIKQNGHPKKVK